MALAADDVGIADLGAKLNNTERANQGRKYALAAMSKVEARGGMLQSLESALSRLTDRLSTLETALGTLRNDTIEEVRQLRLQMTDLEGAQAAIGRSLEEIPKGASRKAHKKSEDQSNIKPNESTTAGTGY